MVNGPSRSGRPGLISMQLGFVEQAVLFQLAFDQGERELGAVDGNVQFREHAGERADVVFVAVSQDDCREPCWRFSIEIGDVGNDDIDAEQFGFGEHQAGIDDDDVVALADGHAVHAELAQAAQGDNLQFSRWH